MPALVLFTRELKARERENKEMEKFIFIGKQKEQKILLLVVTEKLLFLTFISYFNEKQSIFDKYFPREFEIENAPSNDNYVNELPRAALRKCG